MKNIPWIRTSVLQFTFLLGPIVHWDLVLPLGSGKKAVAWYWSDNGAVALGTSSRLFLNPHNSLPAARYYILAVRTSCHLRLSPSYTLDYGKSLELGHNPLNHASWHSWKSKWHRSRGAAVCKQLMMLEILLFCIKGEEGDDGGNIIIILIIIMMIIMYWSAWKQQRSKLQANTKIKVGIKMKTIQYKKNENCPYQEEEECKM